VQDARSKLGTKKYQLREELKGHREKKFTKANEFTDRMAFESNLNLRIYEYLINNG